MCTERISEMLEHFNVGPELYKTLGGNTITVCQFDVVINELTGILFEAARIMEKRGPGNCHHIGADGGYGRDLMMLTCLQYAHDLAEFLLPMDTTEGKEISKFFCPDGEKSLHEAYRDSL